MGGRTVQPHDNAEPIYLDKAGDLPIAIYHCALACESYFCGYVGVPTEHPAHGFAYYVGEVAWPQVPNSSHSRWRIQDQINSLRAPGGLTYAKGNLKNNHWWFGFNTLDRDLSFCGVLRATKALAIQLEKIK
jgi:hypothetical protein